MRFHKRGFNFTSGPMKIVYAFIGIVLLLLLSAELLPEVASALTEIGGVTYGADNTSLPLASLFTGGVILMIIVVVIIVAVIRNATNINK